MRATAARGPTRATPARIVRARPLAPAPRRRTAATLAADAVAEPSASVEPPEAVASAQQASQPPPPADGYAPDAATLLLGLGLPRAAAARLLGRAAALRRRGRRRTPPPPSADDVDGAGRALLGAGLKLSDLGDALARAPGLLNEPAPVLSARVAELASSLPKSAVAAVISFRPSALCAPATMRGLAEGVAALRAAGATPADLGRLAASTPAALWADPSAVLAAVDELAAAGVDAASAPRVLCGAPHALLLATGAAAAASSPRDAVAATLAGAGLDRGAIDAVLTAEPELVALPPARAAAVLDALVAAGVGGADLAALIVAWPRILTKDAADMGAKARAATALLGCPPRALARSPRNLFNRRLPTVLAPRFAFVRERAPALASRFAPSTLARVTDAEFEDLCCAAPGEFAAFRDWWTAEYGPALAAKLAAAGVRVAREGGGAGAAASAAAAAAAARGRRRGG